MSHSLLRIVDIDLVSSFVVDYADYRIYFPNSTQNTMLSAYLDGTDIIDVRKNNVQTRRYHMIKSMVSLNMKHEHEAVFNDKYIIYM